MGWCEIKRPLAGSIAVCSTQNLTMFILLKKHRERDKDLFSIGRKQMEPWNNEKTERRLSTDKRSEILDCST